MVDKGLRNAYIESLSIRNSFKSLKCLVFIPPNDEIEAFKIIKQKSVRKFLCVLTYFEKYYIGVLKSISKSCRSIPTFPISIWNCYHQIKSDEPRTNNCMESWHKQFQSSLCKHPLVNKIVEQFRIEQKHTHILYIQLQVMVIFIYVKRQVF